MNNQNTTNTNTQQNPATSFVALADKTYHEFIRSGKYKDIIVNMVNLGDYTLRNQILIMQQCPNATDVTNKKSWGFRNHKVIDESKAIKILMPRMNTTVTLKDGILDEKEKFSGYDLSQVYDISATEVLNAEKEKAGQKIENFEPYYGAICEGLKKTLYSYTVLEDEIEQDGILDTSKKTITIKQGLTPKQHLTVLIDQLAAAQVIGRDKSKIYGLTSFTLPNVSSVEISAISNIVCQKLNLEKHNLIEPDFDKMSDVLVEKFTKNLGSIRTMSQRLITAIDNAIDKAIVQKKTNEIVTEQNSVEQTKSAPKKASKKSESAMG